MQTAARAPGRDTPALPEASRHVLPPPRPRSAPRSPLPGAGAVAPAHWRAQLPALSYLFGGAEEVEELLVLTISS